MRWLFLWLFFFIIVFLPSRAQERLVALSKTIHSAPSDSLRFTANREFTDSLEIFLRAHALPEKDLPDSLLSASMLVAADKSFRLLTWTVPAVDHGHYSYFGFLQRFDKKTGQAALVRLADVSDTLAKPESARLRDGAWYGCVAYELVQKKKGGKTWYLILGWKGNNALTTKKVIDVLAFQGKKFQFGAPVFKTGKTYKNRMLFEFTAMSSMSLRYEDKKGMIVFDHLSVPSNVSSGEGNMAQFAGPDGTYDALEFKKGRWILLNDINIGTDWKPKKDSTPFDGAQGPQRR